MTNTNNNNRNQQKVTQQEAYRRWVEWDANHREEALEKTLEDLETRVEYLLQEVKRNRARKDQVSLEDRFSWTLNAVKNFNFNLPDEKALSSYTSAQARKEALDKLEQLSNEAD